MYPIMRGAPGWLAKAATARSVPPLSTTSTGVTATPSDGAIVSAVRRYATTGPRVRTEQYCRAAQVGHSLLEHSQPLAAHRRLEGLEASEIATRPRKTVHKSSSVRSRGWFLPHPYTLANRGSIIILAARHRLPAIYTFRIFAAEGGLLSYGFDQIDSWRGAATYVDRILRGEKPADLPVQAPTKFELVVNLKTARALGLSIPPAFPLRADEVIE